MGNRKFLLVLWLFCSGFFRLSTAFGQSTEAQQLLLNVEKLSQLKNLLSDMKRGYELLSNGYNTVRNISKGNFSLHEVFLDGLLLVSPEVRKYHKVAGIISAQSRLVGEYKAAFSAFRASGRFKLDELDYLGRVYSGLLDKSLDNLEELAVVLTSGTLRMSDAERLGAIDRLFSDAEDKLLFLRSFNEQGLTLLRQREKAARELSDMGKLYP